MFKKLLLLLPLALLAIAACRATLPPSPAESVAPEQPVLPAQAITPTPTPPGPIRINLGPIDPPPPPPSPLSTPRPTPRNEEEAIAMRKELLKEMEARGEKGIPASIAGRGMTVTIAGKKIKLPDDTICCGTVITEPDERIQPPRPTFFLRITRGNSTITIAPSNGYIAAEKIAPGEEGAFDFLKKALQ